MSRWPGWTSKTYVFVASSAPRPLPPVRTPLKVPPPCGPGPVLIRVRTVTGTVVVEPSLLLRTIDCAVSPGSFGLFAVKFAVFVSPGSRWSEPGLMFPPGPYVQVSADQSIGPFVPLLPCLA